MKSEPRSASLAGVITLIIAMGSSAVPAIAGCRHLHTHVSSYYGWPDRFAQVSSYRRPTGHGCGPFGDNADGWEIGGDGVCYYPYYGFPYGYGRSQNLGLRSPSQNARRD